MPQIARVGGQVAHTSVSDNTDGVECYTDQLTPRAVVVTHKKKSFNFFEVPSLDDPNTRKQVVAAQVMTILYSGHYFGRRIRRERGSS